ncbi:hypothetical protein [Streptomyces sp. NPDC050145]|uniref:hypothetical protein n=1 Tax=Streptomyces sp. NPDC050145 TaxID=3365602 RepID=UPI00379A347A
MTADSGVNLPEGWSLDGERLVHEAELHGWRLTVVNRLDAPWDGPTSLCIEPPDDLGAGVGTDGITAELMRSISLAEIRRTTKDLRARLGRSTGAATTAAKLSRVETEQEYALMAHAYVQLVQQGYRSPVTRLASAWGLSRNTVSGRIRRARAMGFLEGSPGKPADRLTGKARRHLEGDDGHGESARAGEGRRPAEG